MQFCFIHIYPPIEIRGHFAVEIECELIRIYYIKSTSEVVCHQFKKICSCISFEQCLENCPMRRRKTILWWIIAQIMNFCSIDSPLMINFNFISKHFPFRISFRKCKLLLKIQISNKAEMKTRAFLYFEDEN